MEPYRVRAWILSAFVDGYRDGLWAGFIAGSVLAAMIFIAPIPYNILLAALSVLVLIGFASWGPAFSGEKNETLERILFEMRHHLHE